MICAPIQKKISNDVLQSIKSAQKSVDLLEIWFDEIRDFSDSALRKIFSLKKLPLIYKWQGNKQNLQKVLAYQPEYIDLDLKTAPSIIREVAKTSPGTKIILSFHDFKSTPPNSQLNSIAKKMISKGADIVKIATYASTINDSLRMLEFLSHLAPKQKTICLCMGKMGEITRTTGHLFGNYLMYAPISSKDRTASGQVLAGDLKKIQQLTR